MPPTPRRLARKVGCAASLGLALLAVAATPGLATSPPETGCGLVVVHLAREDFWSLNHVSAGSVACAAARGLVRSWVIAAAAGRIPGRATGGAVTPGGVLIFGRFGPPVRLDGYTCRWANVEPAPHEAFLPGKGECSSGDGVVTWSFHAAANPTLGQVRGCRGGVGLGPAVVSTIRAHMVSCARAKGVIHYLLAHRAIRPGPRGLRIVHATALGFRLSHDGADFRAQHGQSWFSFRLYWYSCGC